MSHIPNALDRFRQAEGPVVVHTAGDGLADRAMLAVLAHCRAEVDGCIYVIQTAPHHAFREDMINWYKHRIPEKVTWLTLQETNDFKDAMQFPFGVPDAVIIMYPSRPAPNTAQWGWCIRNWAWFRGMTYNGLRFWVHQGWLPRDISHGAANIFEASGSVVSHTKCRSSIPGSTSYFPEPRELLLSGEFRRLDRL